MGNRHAPRIERGPEGETIKLGAILSGVIILAVGAAGTAIVATAVLGSRANAAEEDVEALQQDVSRQGRNQIRLDTRVRNTEQSISHANDKLDRLLSLGGVTERIPRPPMPQSDLELPATSAAP